MHFHNVYVLAATACIFKHDITVGKVKPEYFSHLLLRMQAASKLYEKFSISHSFPLLEATIELAFIRFPFIEQPLLCSLLFST